MTNPARARAQLQAARDEALEDAARIVLNQETACSQWFQTTRRHANVYEQLPLVAKSIRALKATSADGEG